ncbi:MAG TPA: DegT/DnrJ/EryC1/StrS family aminotransferase [Thermoanaerobaculia bacterium]|nr:DegT/DnrJ/EryC1/StrS family aminotransferase [Thermoanaerobaculia bacterium]
MTAHPAAPSTRIAIADPAADDLPLRPAIEDAAMRVLRSGRFILGAEVAAFELEVAAFLGAKFVVACANGTDAIALMLSAAGAGAQDEVLVPANACVPVAAGVRLSGAALRFCDVDADTLTMDAASAQRAITPRTRFLLPVHLYGGVADVEGLGELARSRGLILLEDCAQSHGASLRGRRTGTFGLAAAFSFYPTKNLGAYGDGGAVATDDAGLAERLRRLRQYGWTSRDRAEVEGRNSRLDELQAAILRAKLPELEKANEKRRAIAHRYDSGLEGAPLTLLASRPSSIPAAHLYPVRTRRRDALRAGLEARGIETAIHYPVPLHLQRAYAFLGGRPGDFPVSESACETVLSLPIRPSLSLADADAVARAVREVLARA